jgi:hypothetical protein
VPTRARLLALALVGLAPACTSKQRSCERARDVFVTTGTRAIEAASRQGLTNETAERVARAELEHAASRFVPACIEAEPEQFDCIARLDEYVKADAKMRRSWDLCPKDELGFALRDCVDAVRHAAETKFGPCKDTIAEFTEGLWNGPTTSRRRRRSSP